MTEPDAVALGCGLIRLGRVWGARPAPFPTDEEAQEFLAVAVRLGVRLFDTAPAYGSSEERLGRFLRGLPPQLRSRLTIATKMGEYWDPGSGTTRVDMTYDALRRGIDRSLRLLGPVDIIQLHKTTPEALRSDNVRRALAYARSRGVRLLGASVKDVESARIVAEDADLSVVQLPLNTGDPSLREGLRLAASAGKTVLVNRPFGMGALVPPDAAPDRQRALEDAFRFVLAERFSGAVLTGTVSPSHLRENLAAFRAARA